ncbi:MAG: hypothetical protein KDA85_11780 [Planctomycetaceae bacterium]|nr:hypothetical protein [Planctomycetaceae bacterium]
MRALFTAAVAALFLNFCGAADAGDGCCKLVSCGDACCDGCGPTVLCCQPEVKTEKIMRHCFEVECKHICIPPVQLPNCGNSCLGSLFGGNDCAPDQCGAGCSDGCGPACTTCCEDKSLLGQLCSKLTDCRIRTVNTYKKKEYECGEKCVVTWKVVCMPAAGCGKCGDGCGSQPSCCAPLSR